LGPTPIAEPPRIVFVSRRDGNFQLYAVALEGGQPVRLTQSEVDAYAPECSPDGRRIVYWVYDPTASPTNMLWIMRSDGSEPKGFGPGAGRKSWSPDGSQITFNLPWEGDFEIVSVEMQQGQLTRLTTDPASDTMPDWSPDGTTIAFTSFRDGGTPHIYLMAADGVDQRRITNRAMGEYGPAWSPDGKKIAFFAGLSDVNNQLYVVNLDGTGLRQLSDNPGVNDNPAWSPDGEWIAFSSNRNTGDREIYLIHPDGTGLRRLTHSPGDDLTPAWCP